MILLLVITVFLCCLASHRCKEEDKGIVVFLVAFACVSVAKLFLGGF